MGYEKLVRRENVHLPGMVEKKGKKSGRNAGLKTS